MKMREYIKSVTVWTLAGMLILAAGCMQMGRSSQTAPAPAAAEQKSQADALKRFEPASAADNQTVVDSAIELSGKYAALSEEAAKLKLERQNLVTENAQLKDQFNAMTAELAQTKKELTQANDLLVEMRIELNNWKTDVLGFRDEMRQADAAQLETLIKILEALGGESKDISSLKDAAAEAKK